MIESDWLGRETVERHSVDMRQFADFRQATLTGGQRIVEAYNTAGLSYTILPDRGLDIWTAHYRGIPLTWIAQGSPFLPGHAQSFLRMFNGGLLTTCGLTHVGPTVEHPITDGGSVLHGLYSQQRASDIAVQRGWSGKDYILTLSGTVAESKLFGEQLRLERIYRLTWDQPVIEWSDRVVNLGDVPVPLMVLYHINLGYPLICEGTQLTTPFAAIYPRDAEARSGANRWAAYDAAIPNYAEQVFFHHVKGSTDGERTAAALVQESFGLKFEYNTGELPYLTQWKNVRQGIYVCGIEPGNCIPEGQIAARDHGRLVMLNPGEDRHFAVRLTVLDGAEAVQQCRAGIDALRQSGKPASLFQLNDYAR